VNPVLVDCHVATANVAPENGQDLGVDAPDPYRTAPTAPVVELNIDPAVGTLVSPAGIGFTGAGDFENSTLAIEGRGEAVSVANDLSQTLRMNQNLDVLWHILQA
jgi:hypothetical protein